MPRPRKQPTDETANETTTPGEPSETGGPAVNGLKLPTKTEMVRQATTVGHKRKPPAIQEWIAEKYGVPLDYIDANHISNIKSNLRKGGKKPRESAEAGPAAAPARGNGSDWLSVDEIRV